MTNPATLVGDHVDDKFNDWRHDPETATYISRFVQLAVAYRNRGLNRSAKRLCEELRDEGLGIDNTIISRLSLYVMAGYPDLLGGYFRTKTLTAHRLRKAS